MYCWGKSVNGELGLGGIEEEQISAPRELVILSGNSSVRTIACGENHTMFLLDDGRVYSCGSNDLGQLGHTKSRKKPELIDGLSSHKIAHVACGRHHTLVLSKWGDVFSWGHNALRQLGNSSSDVYDSVPRLVKSLATKTVIQLACGAEHSLVLLENGQVFSWGRNNHGQLGSGATSEFEPEPGHVRHLEGVPIVQLACGGYHCFAITQLGAVYCWGRNTFGQLGQNDDKDRALPTHLKALRSQGVRHVSCGEHHTAILTQDGGVFTFGAGSYGQLGHSTFANEIVPRKVLELMGSTITQISCGRYHTMAFEPKRSCVYAFGQGGSGQLGVCVFKNVSSPSIVHGAWSIANGSGRLADDVPSVVESGVTLRRIFCGGDRSFVTVTPKKVAVAPDDLRYFYADAQLPQLTLSMAIGCAQIKEHELASQDILKYVETVFGSAVCINASFIPKGSDRTPSSWRDPCIDVDEVSAFFKRMGEIKKASLTELILERVQTELMPSLVSSPVDLEAMRVYLILAECHLFDDPVHYNTLCTPFGKAILNLEPESGKVLDHWWGAWTSPGDFQRLVEIYKKCVVCILDRIVSPSRSDRGGQHDSLATSLGLLSRLNRVNREHGQVLPYEVFYIPEITEKLDVRLDYINWANYRTAPQANGGRLYLCDYPFLFDAKAKTLILQTDAVLQMQLAMDEVHQRNFTSLFFPVDPANPYLVLVVSRANLVQDTLSQLMSLGLKSNDLKKPLKVVFDGEDAVDGGGVRKEFFMLLMKDLTDPKYGMFKVYDETHCIWFNENTFETHEMFSLIGLLCGLAIYNGNIINLPFPLALYRKLLGEPVKLEDLRGMSPSLHKSLGYMLDYEGDDFEDVFVQYFEICVEAFGQVETYELKPGGRDEAVTVENRKEYVAAYVDFLLNTAVQKQYAAFHEGFHRVLGGRVLELFHSQELMAMVVGNENYDWKELESNAEYKDDYSRDHPTIVKLWQVFHELDLEQKKRFLLFLTGYDRIPIFGMKSVKLIVQPTSGGDEFLPVAHTCFNLLDLPRYASKAKLREKLLLAIEHTQGFGLA